MNNMNNKKYYICVTPFFPSPERWQGAYILDQVKAIVRNSDYEVIVFKTCPLYDKQSDYIIDGIKVYTIRPLLMPSYILNGLTDKVVGHMFLNTLSNLNIRLSQIAFVHCHTTNHTVFGLAVKQKNSKTKVLVQFHDPDPLTLRNGMWADKLWNKRYRARKSVVVLNQADLLICVSEPVRDALLAFPHPRKYEIYSPAINMLKGVSDIPPVVPKKIYILNNGVDTSIFYPQKKNIGLQNSKRDTNLFRIGCIANFQDLKGHYTLVEAFNILINKGYTNMRLSLLGTGCTRIEIENYIKDHSLSKWIEWPKEVHHEKLPEYYHSLDLFVLPSYFEGFGCVYTEAYACGVPFIGCYHQGIAEYIVPEERDLWLVTPKDSKQLAERIENYYLYRKPQHLCKPYDINILISQFLEYIKSL